MRMTSHGHHLRWRTLPFDSIDGFQHRSSTSVALWMQSTCIINYHHMSTFIPQSFQIHFIHLICPGDLQPFSHFQSASPGTSSGARCPAWAAPTAQQVVSVPNRFPNMFMFWYALHVYKCLHVCFYILSKSVLSSVSSFTSYFLWRFLSFLDSKLKPSLVLFILQNRPWHAMVSNLQGSRHITRDEHVVKMTLVAKYTPIPICE